MSDDWWLEQDPSTCPEEHPVLSGPCMDIGQCPKCWTPIGVMRPAGETIGMHADDCSLPERHQGECVGGGNGHRPGIVRGYWPNMDDDILKARQRYDERNPR